MAGDDCGKLGNTIFDYHFGYMLIRGILRWPIRMAGDDCGEVEDMRFDYHFNSGVGEGYFGDHYGMSKYNCIVVHGVWR